MSNLPISKRAANTLDIECSLDRINTLVREKLLDPEFNPNGVLNLGLAHNDLLQEKVFEKSKACLEIVPNDVNYGAPHGSRQLRQLMQEFITRHFHPYYPLDPGHMFAQTGAGASVNQLLMAVADPGDYCMIPGPYYGMFDLDISVHTGVNILPIYLHQKNGLKDMSVDMDLLDATYSNAKSDGKRITSMIITNPENPVGRCYSKKDIETLLRFGSKYHIHLVFDEIYALSSFSHLLDETQDDPFISVLSLPYKDFIDPSLVHVIYGLSKDFAVNGFRVGYIIDQFNRPLKQTLLRAASFTYTSTITDRLLVNMFSDTQWIDSYLIENRQALADTYSKTIKFLKLHNIDYIEGEAGVFFLIDVRSFGISTFSEEEASVSRMIQHGVYLAPGFAFHTTEPGFFRLTFSLPWSILETGLKQLVKALNDL